MRGAGFVAGSMLIACGAVYLLAGAGVFPLLLYLPAAHTWTFHRPPGVIAIDWYARAGVSLGAAVIAFVIARVLARHEWAARASTARVVLGLGFALVFWAALDGVFTMIAVPRGPAPTRSVTSTPAR